MTKELDVEKLTGLGWERTLDELTEDMDPWDIDILELTRRYRQYIQRLGDYDLKIPGRLILVCSVLLRIKTDFLSGVEEEEELEEGGEMIEEEMEQLEEQQVEQQPEEPELYIPDIEFPVRKKQKRKVTLDELKQALNKAIDIKKKRKERKEEREEFNLELDQEDVKQKVDRLFNRLRSYITDEEDKIKFEQVLNKKTRQEKVEKFFHILHLETDEKIKCSQPEFLGELLIALESELKQTQSVKQESN